MISNIQLAIFALIIVGLKISFDNRIKRFGGGYTFKGFEMLLQLISMVVTILAFMIFWREYKWYVAIIGFVFYFFVSAIVNKSLSELFSTKALFIVSSLLLLVVLLLEINVLFID